MAVHFPLPPLPLRHPKGYFKNKELSNKSPAAGQLNGKLRPSTSRSLPYAFATPSGESSNKSPEARQLKEFLTDFTLHSVQGHMIEWFNFILFFTCDGLRSLGGAGSWMLWSEYTSSSNVSFLQMKCSVNLGLPKQCERKGFLLFHLAFCRRGIAAADGAPGVGSQYWPLLAPEGQNFFFGHRNWCVSIGPCWSPNRKSAGLFFPPKSVGDHWPTWFEQKHFEQKQLINTARTKESLFEACTPVSLELWSHFELSLPVISARGGWSGVRACIRSCLALLLPSLSLLFLPPSPLSLLSFLCFFL